MSPRVCDSLLRTLFLLVGLSLLTSTKALGHDVAQHLDPELLTGWRTWLHLTIQWAHLVAFALWLGLTAGVLALGIKPRLEALLYCSWVLFLVSLATGTYNMEWSAGISETPSLFLLPLLDRIPYGVTYTVVLAVKLVLYVAAVLFTLVMTVLHLGRWMGEERLRKIFVISGAALAVLITLAASVVLFYHEVADVWPTAIHSLGGVVGPEGPRGQTIMGQNLPPPNDFQLLTSRAAWMDIGVQWVHLLGFGLWLGGTAAALVFGPVSPARFLLVAWIALILQVFSGIISMQRWTPFYLPPYVWNLDGLSGIRFGRSYTLFMGTKHFLVMAAISLITIATVQYLKSRTTLGTNPFNLQPFAAMSLLLALATAYIMIIVLLLHEGIDHAL